MSEQEDRRLRCPKCQARMELIHFDETEVDRCTCCQGIWFDVDEHARLMTEGGSEKLDTGDRREGLKHDSVRDIDCPVCDLRMLHRVAYKRREIHFEQCDQCMGAFFDAGEFTDLKEEKGFVDLLLSVFSLVDRKA